MSASALPEHLRPYFWDTDFDTLDLARHRRFIAERLMDRTTPGGFHWLLAHYSRTELRDIAATSRRLSARDRDFWRIYCDAA